MIGENSNSKWYFKPIIVVLLLFLVLGPLGLPLLYKSPHFGKVSKTILTIAVMIYTTYLIYASLEIVQELWKMMEELRKLSG